MNNIENRNKVLDIAKYLSSFMIVAIHCGLYPKVFYPWLRIAVPMFFMISSYLLWNKIVSNNDNELIYIYIYS